MSRASWVYVIAKNGPEGISGPVKVGISSNPTKRLATIQTACPFPVQLIIGFQCPDHEIARHIERSFHETRKDKRLYGEWFDYHPCEAILILCIAFRVALHHNVDDPELVADCLELSGVLRAEKSLNVKYPPSIPGVRLQ